MIFPVYGVLCAASSSGIQTAISRLTAAEASSGADTRFRAAAFSLPCFWLLLEVRGSGLRRPLAETLLGEPRCAPLLRALAFCVPLSSIHACISGFYYGLMRAAVPSLSLLAEQSARMLFIFMAWKISLQEGMRCAVRHPCGRWGPESWLRCSSVSRQWDEDATRKPF